MGALALDLGEHGVGPQVRAVLFYCEEWLEVIVYAVLAQTYLALIAHSSLYGTENAKSAFLFEPRA